MARPDVDLLGDVTRLREDAVRAHNEGHPAVALRVLKRAAARLDAAPPDDDERLRPVRAAVWISLALNEGEVKGPAAGLIAMARAQEHCQGLDDPGLQVRLHIQYGHMAYRGGQIELASEQFERAFTMEDAADPHDRFGMLLNAGNLRMSQGRVGEAHDLVKRASLLAEADGDPLKLMRSLHNLGYVTFLQGRLVEALDYMHRAADVTEGSDGVASLDRARVLIEAGLVREAGEALVEAWNFFSAERLGQDLGEVEVARAEAALLAGEPRAARRFAGSARDRFRRRGNDRWRRTAELVLLQADLAAARPGLRLAGPALRLEEELRRADLGVRARTAALVAAEALLSAGRVREAAGVAGRIGLPRPGDPLTSRLHVRYVQARLAVSDGDRRSARRHIRDGLRELSVYQASFGGIEMRTASAIHGTRLAELDQRLALDDGVPGAVFDALERSRAVSSRLPPVEPPEDEQTAALLTSLRQVVEAIRAALQDAGELQRRRHDLERQIAARSWTLPGAGAASRPVSLPKVRELLGDRDSTMIAYLRSAEELHALVVDAGRARLVALGPAARVEELVLRVRADFDVLASDLLPDGLRDAANGSLGRGLRELDDLLLAPLGPTARTVIVPVGILGALPWTALPSRSGVPLVVAPSATAWFGASTAERAVTGPTVALAGPMLLRARSEVAEVAAVVAGTAGSGGAVIAIEEGVRADLLAALSTAQVVHIAAHGQHQTQNPLFSSVRMGDGSVFAHELTRSAPHVVLSACELGAVTVGPGDEALGLTGVLLRMGTASVVSSVTRVGDAAAAEVMVGYHRRLSGGDDSAAALAGALAEQGRPLPFVCFGSAWRR